MTTTLIQSKAKRTDGLDHIERLRASRYSDDLLPTETIILETFGTQESDGFENTLTWVVRDRPDRRHGFVSKAVVVDKKEQELNERMFAKWRQN